MAGKTKVFLRGFDFGTTVEDIEAHCATAGVVVSVDLKGKGGALVTYGSEEDSKRAVDDLHRSIIEGNTRYIDVSLKSGAADSANESSKGKGKSSKGKSAALMALPYQAPGKAKPQGAAGNHTEVTVRGFDFGTTEADVRTHFARVGKVSSVEMTGTKGGSAVVTFTSLGAAEKAVAQLDKSVIGDNTRYIDLKIRGGSNQQMAPANGGGGQWTFVPSGGMPPMAQQMWMVPVGQRGVANGPKAQATSAVINVRGFDFETSEDAVKKHCSKVGKVLSVELKGKGGSAVVTFSSPKAAEKAVQQLQQTVIEGNVRYIDVKLKSGADQQVGSKNAVPATVKPSKKRKAGNSLQTSEADGCRIFVRGFDKGTTLETIVDHCSTAGSIGESVMSGNFSAILTFSSQEEAEGAVESLNKSTIEGNSRYIDVKIDEGKSSTKTEGGPQKKARTGEKEKGASGPNLTREIVHEIGTIIGTVVKSIRGKSGFIKPHEAIDHPEANKHKGDIYFHSQDVVGDVLLEKNAEVQFVVYVDASGLGAQEIMPVD